MYSIQFYTLERQIRESELRLPFERDITMSLNRYRPVLSARTWDGISVLDWTQNLVRFCLGYICPGRSIQLLASFGRSFRRDEPPWDRWIPADLIGLNGFEVEAIRRAIPQDWPPPKLQKAKSAKVASGEKPRKRVRKIPTYHSTLSSDDGSLDLDHHFIESCFELFERQGSITGRSIGGLDCRNLSIFRLP